MLLQQRRAVAGWAVLVMDILEQIQQKTTKMIKELEHL